jgi:hypothetical protein
MPSNNEATKGISRIAGADLSSAKYRFCKVQADSTVVLAGNGERGLGVIDAPGPADHAVGVKTSGRVQVIAGATVTAGLAAQSDANGAAINQASTGVVMGIFLEGGVVGDIVSLDLAPQGAP